MLFTAINCSLNNRWGIGGLVAIILDSFESMSNKISSGNS